MLSSWSIFCPIQRDNLTEERTRKREEDTESLLRVSRYYSSGMGQDFVCPFYLFEKRSYKIYILKGKITLV